jgi:hypothetical protein
LFLTSGIKQAFGDRKLDQSARQSARTRQQVDRKIRHSEVAHFTGIRTKRLRNGEMVCNTDVG